MASSEGGSVSCNNEKVFSKIPLPGSGGKPPGCAGYFIEGFCGECGRIHLHRGNCRKAVCPDCSTTWRYDRTKKILERILSYKWDRSKRVRHFVVSPSPKVVAGIESLEDLLDLFQEVYNLAAEKGSDGGLVIFHPYRLIKERKPELRAIASERYDWKPGKFHLWKALVSLDNWREYVYFSPHFHVLATCDRGEKFQEGDKGRFIWKGVSELGKAEVVLKCSMYLLSHVGILSEIGGKNYHALRWFGDLAPCNWSLDRATENVRRSVESRVGDLIGEFEKREGVELNCCSECGAELLPIELAPAYFDKLPEEKEKRLRSAWWACELGIPPPRWLEDRDEVFEWLRDQFPGIFSEGSIFQGVDPQVSEEERRKIQGEINSPQRVREIHKQHVQEREKWLRDPQKKIDHYKETPKPTHVVDDRAV